MQQPNALIFTFDTIGSRFWLEDLTGTPLPLAVQRQVLAYVQQFDDNYSRFKSGSLVTRLAATGTLEHPPAELLDMLDLSKEMHRASNGAFNVTVGTALSRLGYGNNAHAKATPADPWPHVSWNRSAVRVPKGVLLDFGGLGKGWLIDGIASILQQNGIYCYVVNGGGDLYVHNTEPIEFALEDPLRPGNVLRTVHLKSGALAGSDTIKRAWDTAGGRKHHIIDPAKQDSSDSGVVACYVMAGTALVADMVATVLIIKPELQSVLEKQYRCKALLLRT